MVQNTYTSGQISSTRAFLYDREDVIAEFSNDTFATVFRRYIHGPGIDEPLAIMGDDVGEYAHYLHDGLGSVTGVVDENGKLGAIDYSAFGETRSNTVKIENRYRYTSREFVETNLYYYRARHMRPDLGRFISMDPLKTVDGTNMFGYVGNNPQEWVDPYGTINWRKGWEGFKHWCSIFGDSGLTGGAALCNPNLLCQPLKDALAKCLEQANLGLRCSTDCDKIQAALWECLRMNNNKNNQSSTAPGPPGNPPADNSGSSDNPCCNK